MIEIHQDLDPGPLAKLASFVEESDHEHGHYGECAPGWLQVLRSSLGHQPFHLISRSSHGSIDGYLPLALVESRLFGRFLVSLPYVTHAGIVTSEPRVGTELRDNAVRLAEELDVDHLEIRGDMPSGDSRFSEARTDKARMTRPLPSDPDDLWADVGPKIRNRIRKGAGHDFTLHFGRHELLDGLYSVLSENMRDLGSPIHPRAFFSAILDSFPEKAELAVVVQESRTIGAALLLHRVRGRRAGPATTVPVASCLRSVRQTSINTWLYHQLMRRAMSRGSIEFDFGRSSIDSGPYRFKHHWGARPQQTYWEYYVRRGDLAALRPDSEGNAFRVAAWKRLPVWLTQVVGPRIVRGIP